MNGSSDSPLTYTPAPDDTRPCGLISIIPSLGGMASCRGRAEAFARSLSSKLKTLGSSTDTASEEEKSNINGASTNTWVNTSHGSAATVTDLQPLRHESNSFFNFDCELESPGSPVDERDFLQLIETTSNTTHNFMPPIPPAIASGCVCTASKCGDDIADSECCNFKETTDSISSAEEVSEFCSPLQLKRTASVLEEICSNGCDQLIDTSECILSHEEHQDQGNNQHFQNTSSSEFITQPETTFQGNKERTIQDATEEISLEHQLMELLTHCDDLPSISRSQQSEINNTDEKDLLENRTTTDEIPSTDALTLTGQQTRLQLDKTEDCSAEDAAESKLEEKTVLSSSCESKTPTTDSTCGHNSVLDTDDEDDCRPQRVRRCSSLKTGKTPPGTPGRKKIVRFADVLGLDLADVKTFLDEIPTIPRSAFEDLEIMELEQPIQLGPKSDKLLMPLFQQPGGLSTFLDVVREKQVSLDNAAISDPINQTITGSVRVRNLDFHKSVHIRYSLDGWRSFADLQANYVPNSCDGFSDKFTFVLFGNSLQIGQRLEFAVRFQCKGQQFWDNNYGMNYCFQCLPTASSVHSTASSTPAHHMAGLFSPIAGDSWCSSFY